MKKSSLNGVISSVSVIAECAFVGVWKLACLKVTELGVYLKMLDFLLVFQKASIRGSP